MAEVVLYHVAPSFYSQVARIALEEKGVRWRSHLTVAGPPRFDNYEPWYVRLNPACVVPTLSVDGKPVCESVDIARFVDAHFDGPRLTPEDPKERAEMDRWLQAFVSVSVRGITYGTPDGLKRRIARLVNEKRIRRLHELRDEHPSLAEIYDAKIRDMEDFVAQTLDQKRVQAARKQAADYLDELDELLGVRLWIAGASYSLADALWTVMVARLVMVKQAPLEGRPHLARWYAKVRARPSFESASVWDRVRPAALLSVAARVYAWQLGLIVLALIALVWVLV